jgi:hypothetical protein
MVSKTSVVVPTSFAVFFGLIAVWLKWRESHFDALNEAAPLWSAVEMDWDLEKMGNEGYPQCYRPQILRNVVQFPNDGECKDKDNCVNYIRERMLDMFGDRNIPLFASELATGPQESVHWVNLRDFLENQNTDKYADWAVEGFTRVGTEDEYEKFFGFDNNYQSYLHLKNMGKNGEFGQYTHAGTTFYLIDNTPLHLEWGTNFYVMLGGRKRWLLVHPKYYEACNCNLGGRALHGACYVDSDRLKNVTQGVDEVEIDLMKDILVNEVGIPPEYMIDVTLNPGDVLVSCDLWLHATKKLDENGIAMSLRMVQPLNPGVRAYQPSTIKRVFESVYTGLISKWKNPHFHSFVDGYRQDLLENDPRYENPETFTCKDR